MKFFVFFALVAMASATLNYNLNGQSLVVNGRNAYGNLLTSGSYGLGGYYGSGARLGYGLGGYTSGAYGLNRVAYGGAYAAPAYSQGLVLAGAAPVAKYGYASLAAPAVAIGGYGIGGYSQGYAQSTGPVNAAILSQRSVQVVDVPSTGGIAAPQSVVIGPSVQPLDLEFQSQSSPVNVRQTHIPGQANEPQFSKHEEQPDYLKQEIVKPIVHEVTEAIQPFRKITQEVRPVQETIQQLITRGQQQQVAYAAPAVQAVQSYAAAPVATVAVAQPAYQSFAVAQPTLAVAAAPAYSTGYTTGLSGLSGGYTTGLSGLSGLSGYSTGLGLSGLSTGYTSGLTYAAKPALALTGSTQYISKPALALSGSTSYASEDAYRK